MPPPKMTPEERKMFEDAVIDGLAKGAEDPIGLEQEKLARWHGVSKSVAHLFEDPSDEEDASEDAPTDEDMEDAPTDEDEDAPSEDDYPEPPGMF